MNTHLLPRQWDPLLMSTSNSPPPLTEGLGRVGAQCSSCLCCAWSLLSSDLSSGELQQTQDKRSHCVSGQECSGSRVRECHRATDSNGLVRLSEPCSRSRPWAKWQAWVFPVMETSFHITLPWLPDTRRTRLVWGENIAEGN